MLSIINASAGTGKTYTLVKNYLFEILSKNSNDEFKKLIGLTFTNKAVFEMKSRIIRTLYYFSKTKDKKQYQSLFLEISKKTNLSTNELEYKSGVILKKILHQYSFFEIKTLDKFSLKIIRDFYKDLDIAYNFQVELNSEIILNKIIKRIINKVGRDPLVTKILVNYSSYKLAQTKSLNIELDLLLISKLLLKENNFKNFQSLKKESLKDFYNREINFYKIQEKLKNEIKEIGFEGIKKIKNSGLLNSDFKYNLIPRFFSRLSKLDLNNIFKNKLENNLIEKKNLFNKNTAESKRELIDNLIPILYKMFFDSKKIYSKYLFISEVRKHFSPMAFFKMIEDELQEIQKEENKLLIETFNFKIFNKVLNFSSPYIYEKLGEKYKYFFLDEFQDTSFLQWQNLIPLISNSIENMDESGETGKLLLVGDPKQSIYRWRGGNVEQFIDLLSQKSPFQIKSKILTLKKNYRSSKKVVNFNNSFFKSILKNTSFKDFKIVFESATSQSFENKIEGYVEIEQFDYNNKIEDLNRIYCKKTVSKINFILSKNYNLSDIAILVRKKNQAILIAEELIKNNIPFSSQDSLKLSSSEKVNYLINLIKLTTDEEDKNYRKVILDFLFDKKAKNSYTYHQFIHKYLNSPIEKIFFGYNEFDYFRFTKLSLYDAIEYAVYSFRFSKELDIFTNSFLNEIFNYTKSNKSDFCSFIDYWDLNHSNLVVPNSESLNSVKLLTIHKSKGLEFPIVILPFFDEPIQPRRNDQVWINSNSVLKNNNFNTLINFSDKLKMFGEQGEDIYGKKIKENEFDALTVLYVSLTRAINCNFIITKIPRKNEKKSYSSLIEDLKIDSSISFEDGLYRLGKLKLNEKIKKNHHNSNSVKLLEKKYDWESKLVCDTNEKKTERGILIHDLLQKIDSVVDIDLVVDEFIYYKKIEIKEKNTYVRFLKNILNNKLIKKYFTKNYSVQKEIEVLSNDKNKIRIDRLIIKGKIAIIMDFKTGKIFKDDKIQLINYEDKIIQTGLIVEKKILVYTDYNPIKIIIF
tara:strand:+ start:157040 stop:160129 length:3090 start_codon:yes stop_codon:yes gene_type:complete